MKLILCIIYLFFSISGLTFMKLGSGETAKLLIEALGFRITIQSAIGYICYILSFLLYTVIITKFDLSYIVPVLGGIVNVVVLIIGILLFQEKATSFSVMGALLVVFGIFLMNFRK